MRDYKIMLVDDDPRYADSFIDKAKLKDFDVIHILDWESALSELKLNFNLYGAIIIDGLGKLNQDGKGDDPMHLNQVLNDIKVLRGEGRYLPYYINTAYYDELYKFFGKDPIFDKKKNQENMLLDAIDKEVGEIEINRIKASYSDIFECFGGKYLPVDTENKLIEILLELNSTSLKEGSFNTLRKIIEAVYKRLYEIDDKLIPISCMNFEKETVNFELCARRLLGEEIRDFNTKEIIFPKGDKVIPEHFGWLLKPLDKVCSICSHNYKDERFVNKYTLLTITNGVLEFIIWFKKFVDEKYT